MKVYFFKTETGEWCIGDDSRNSFKSGSFAKIHSVKDEKDCIGIGFIGNSDYLVQPRPVTNFVKNSSGDTYANLEEFETATRDFFAKGEVKAELIDPSGNPSGKPSLVDTTSETIIYEGYKSGSSYRICKLDASSAIFSRTWATGTWADRATLNYA